MARPLLLDLALTHILGRKRQTIVSVLGVALGVGFFIAMAALMQGFQGYFIETVINASPHITVRDQFREPAVQPVAMAFEGGAVLLHGLKPREEVRGIRKAGTMVSDLSDWPGLSVAPSLDGPVILRYGSTDRSVVAIGIDPEREVHVTQLEDDMIQGSLTDLSSTATGIVMGLGLANKLGAKLGDSLNAISPAGVILRVKIVGLFRTGVSSLDEGQAYILLKKAQILQSRANVINQLRIRLTEVDAAREVAARIEALYGYRSESWQEANEGVFGVFKIQNSIMYSTVGAIMVVAAFGIYNIISTVVYEKSRDIAILKSIGLTERDIRRTFLMQGLMIGMIGAVLGWMIGLGLTALLSTIRFDVGNAVRNDRFFLAWSLTHYWIGALFSLSASVVAAWIPARRAAGANPVDIIRGAA
ncbi:ABC transporter [Skermanella stibiiresistens SB22]|uniref:ABC transporter n=1 Tax=Skermanella stibiiresistens SB22 TaxID=1385369 RepID=W9H8J1_9PROT|nr:ABC transporter permease [Skermanella stibiiresistens]EWY41071.1 ABC transporter [Skermanella stibiiresistens SB22]